MRVAPIVLVAAGCGYHAGSFAGPEGPFVGLASTVGCLDITIARKPDIDRRPVLAFDFGNRCSRPIVVDFQHARVEAVTGDGRRIQLAPYDPDGDIIEEQLDAQLWGHEAIAFDAGEPAPQVCIDVATIAHVAGTQWKCLASPAVTP